MMHKLSVIFNSQPLSKSSELFEENLQQARTCCERLYLTLRDSKIN